LLLEGVEVLKFRVRCTELLLLREEKLTVYGAIPPVSWQPIQSLIIEMLLAISVSCLVVPFHGE
jgi:hypothetical protein